MDVRKLLERMGYPVYHSNILLFLIKQKEPVNAKEISNGSEVPLSRVYSILIELEKQSLVKSAPGKITTYTVVDKKTFLQQVRSKKDKQLRRQRPFRQLKTTLPSKLFCTHRTK